MHAYRAFALSLLLALPACGGNVVVDKDIINNSGAPTCETVCPKLQEACPGQADSCSLMCETFDQFSSQGACPTEIDAYFLCLDENPSFVCSAAGDSCESEATDLATCLVDFCSGQPNGC